MQLPLSDGVGARMFGFIEKFEVIEDQKERMIAIDVTLNQRTLMAIESNSVLDHACKLL